jgi:protein-arginine kinase activator protein McsA
MQSAIDEASNLRYHVCVRCNKRHTHKRFQGKKPHTDVPSDWKDVIGLYTNKHTGKPITLKNSASDPIMCHSCHKQYVNRCNKRAAPSSYSPDYANAKRPCRQSPDLNFEHIVDVFLYISDHRPSLHPQPVASSS